MDTVGNMFGTIQTDSGSETGHMGAIPGGIETDQQPPLTIPLGHFVVGLGFLVFGSVLGVGSVAGLVPGQAALAHVHLLLVGWVCVTIMGAMIQFVPVWSGTSLYSRRLASLQLALVGFGLLGFVAGLLASTLLSLIPFGALVLAGFWTFVYNIVRTMASLDSYDITERHFLLALVFFLVLTSLGVVLAVDFTWPIFSGLPVDRENVVAAHGTLAVFGAILTTVYGALYQLGTMFTQTDLHGIDEPVQRIEEIGHPVGVGLLALGRLLGMVPVARVGGILVLVSALAVSSILARKLVETRVEWVPMHTRYSVVVVSLSAWALWSLPAWVQSPTVSAHRLGAPGAFHLIGLGTVGFVVFGTLYHVVPFIIWVHRYSDLLGFEEVPMIEDLYEDRLAAVDATLLVAGTLVLVVAGGLSLSQIWHALGGGLVSLGIVVFCANMLLVVHEHSPDSLGRILLEALAIRRRSSTTG